MYEQTPEDVDSGILRIRLDGEEKTLPLLVIDESERWQALLIKRASTALDDVEPGSNERILSLVAGIASSLAVDLIAEYDQTHVLAPSKAALRRKLNQRQASEIFKAIVSAEFPLAEVIPLLVEQLTPTVGQLVNRLLSGRSTSSPSDTGAGSPPALSVVSSPGASSSRSGSTARSGSSARRRSARN